MDRAERWARAKAETHGLKDWRRGVATAVAAGVCSVLVLALFGPEDAEVAEALVIGGSILGAYILRPLAELAWNFAWGPWRALNEAVSALSRKQSEIKAPDERERAASRAKVIRARLQILRSLEGELRPIRKRLAEAQEKGYAVSLSIRHPFWDAAEKQGFGGVADMQGLFVELRDLMDELEAVELSRVSSMGKFDSDDYERLSKAQAIVEKALGILEAEIDRLVAAK
ncbi:MAG TPA: hypothetical protein VFI09_06660 [Solirubrobacterales bacterium]|nr:hypothetical protein [Solirubrobacterales bacterium]